MQFPSLRYTGLPSSTVSFSNPEHPKITGALIDVTLAGMFSSRNDVQ